MSKILGFIVGALALVGALVLLNHLYKYHMNKSSAVSAGQVAAATNAPAVVVATADQVTMPAPCVAAALPVAMGCDGTVFAPQTGRDDLFPGSYVNFGLYNTGCYGNVRNRKC